MKIIFKGILYGCSLSLAYYVSLTAYTMVGLEGYRAWREADRAMVARTAIEHDRQIRGCK